MVAPSGVLRSGELTRIASTNATIGADLGELGSAPVRMGSGTPVYLRDVASVENGSDILTAYAHVNGKRTVYIPVTKRPDASTLDVMQRVRAALPGFQKVVPEDVQVRVEFDQSGAVSSALRNLVQEGLLGALLTGLMVLFFLRDWRSALIVVATIPISLLTAVVLLWGFGQTINIMTLAGLALAVGVLVDEATVEIENIRASMDTGVEREEAVRTACQRTAIPRLLSMLSILAVFVPSFFMTGVGKQLFVPLSLAVGFAMIASYLLSSTLVPVLAVRLMRPGALKAEPAYKRLYRGFVQGIVAFRWPVALGYVALTGLALWMLLPRLGVEIFPPSDVKQLRLRLFMPTGTRIERTEPVALDVLNLMQEAIGREKVEITSSFVGQHASSYPVSLIHLFTTGPHEAVLVAALKPGVRIEAEEVREKIRSQVALKYPQVRLLFEAGDIVSQVMSFGSPSPVRVLFTGPSLANDQAHALKVLAELKKLSFLRDTQIQQPADYPTLELQIDRDRAGQYGLTTQDVTRSLVTATSSSRFIEPSYWRDPVSGNAFQVQVEVAANRMQSAEDLAALPLMKNGQSQPLTGDIVKMKPGLVSGMVERWNGQKLVSIVANLHGLTLGEAVVPLQAAIAKAGEAPRGVTVSLQGQAPPLAETMSGLQSGLLLAVGSIFLLLAAAFQSFRLSLVVLLISPAIVAGAAAALWLTGTSLNIQSYLGAILAVGIAVANSILYISFAQAKGSVVQASGERVRAIVMTALAMLAGMLPLALGIGEGGSQTAPLGVAVIGGLVVATLATLSVLPALYSIVEGEKA